MMIEPTDAEVDQAHEPLGALVECVRERVPVGIGHLAVVSAAAQLAVHHALKAGVRRDALLHAIGNVYDLGPLS